MLLLLQSSSILLHDKAAGKSTNVKRFFPTFFSKSKAHLVKLTLCEFLSEYQDNLNLISARLLFILYMCIQYLQISIRDVRHKCISLRRSIVANKLIQKEHANFRIRT